MEMWRKVSGYDHYEVSDRGAVRSFAQKKPREIKPGLASHGYLTVSLWKSGVGKSHCVHSLVAEAFIGPSMGLDVDHIDGDRANNAIVNLRYQSQKENRGKPHAKTYMLKGPGGDAICVENLSNFCRKMGLNRSSMGSVTSGRMAQHNGWISL